MPGDDSFLNLVQRVNSQDELAAEELVRRFEPELRRIIRFQLTDPGLRRLFDSLDVCQSVLAAFFAQLYSGALEITHPKQLMNLLALMAKHKVIDRARQNRSQRRGGGKTQGFGPEVENLLPDSGADPSEMVANQELLERLKSQLSELERTTLDRWLSGQEWAEIAKDLNDKPEALRKRLSRAIDRGAIELGLLEEPQ